MTKPVDVIEQKNAYEWQHVEEVAAEVGASLAYQLYSEAQQLPLFELTTLREVLRQRLADENPDSLIVDSRVFDDYRYQAGVLASELRDDQIASAALGTRMRDQIENHPHTSIIFGQGNSFDLGTMTHVIAPEDAAVVFAKDYHEIATDRLCGFDLRYRDDDDETDAVLAEQDETITLKRKVDASIWVQDPDSEDNLEDIEISNDKIPDWLEEEMHGFIDSAGSYDHEGFVQYLIDSGYPRTVEDERSIRDWGMQQAENLRQEGEA